MSVCVVIIHNCFSQQSVLDAASIGQELVFNQSAAGKWVQLFFSQGLCRCAVPLFLMFAAFLQVKKNDPYPILLKKRVKSLLVPYLLWFCIYLVYPHLMKLLLLFIRPEILKHPDDTLLNWHFSDWFHYFLGYGELDIHGDIGCPRFAIQFWFVRDLFILILLSPILKYFAKRFKFGFLLIVTFLLLCPVKHLFFIRTQSVFFYTLGLYWALYDIPVLETVDKISWKESFAFFALTFVVTWLFYDKLATSYWFMNVAAGIILLKLSALIVSNEKSFSIASRLSPYSFFMYAVHIFLMNFIRPLWIKAFPMKNDFFCLFEYFGVSFLIIAFSLGIGVFLKKFFLPVFALLNGGRK